MVETWWPAGVVRVHANLDPFSAKFSPRSAIQSLPWFSSSRLYYSSVFSFASRFSSDSVAFFFFQSASPILFIPSCQLLSIHGITSRSGRSANWPCDSSPLFEHGFVFKSATRGGKKEEENSDGTFFKAVMAMMIFFYGLREFWRNKVGFNNWKANIWLQFLANFSKLEHIFARNCNRGIFREHLSLLTNDSSLNNSLLKNIFFNAVNLIILRYNVSINRRREKEYITLDKNYQKNRSFYSKFFSLLS